MSLKLLFFKLPLLFFFLFLFQFCSLFTYFVFISSPFFHYARKGKDSGTFTWPPVWRQTKIYEFKLWNYIHKIICSYTYNIFNYYIPALALCLMLWIECAICHIVFIIIFYYPCLFVILTALDLHACGGHFLNPKNRFTHS